MKIKSFSLSFLLTLLLATVAVGGDMPGPGAAQKPPETIAGKTTPAICEPQVSRAGWVGTGSTCEEATPDSAAEAMIFAIQTLFALY